MTEDRRRRRWVLVVSLAFAGAALSFLMFGRIGANLVYYWSPSEMKAAGAKAVGAEIRLGGLVAPGSIQLGSDGLDLRFDVTDGTESVSVLAKAVPPAMFREGIGVVVEGTLRSDGRFETDRLMIKHDNQYRAPGEGDKPDIKKMAESMQLGDA